MANENALEQARIISSRLKADLRIIDRGLREHQDRMDDLESMKMVAKKNLEETEKAILILEAAQKDYAKPAGGQDNG